MLCSLHLWCNTIRLIAETLRNNISSHRHFYGTLKAASSLHYWKATRAVCLQLIWTARVKLLSLPQQTRY